MESSKNINGSFKDLSSKISSTDTVTLKHKMEPFLLITMRAKNMDS